MKAAYNSDAFRSFLRILPVVAIAVLLAGPPQVWAQCVHPQVDAAVSPSDVFEGNPVTLTVTITMSHALQLCDTGGGAWEVNWGIVAPGGRVLYASSFNMLTGQSSFTFPLLVNISGYTQPVTATLSAGAWANGPAGKVAYLGIIPQNMVADPPGNFGQSGCPITCGHPINLTDGNVWIPQRDYSVPGLGGGLVLSRVWNSRWMGASPPAFAGMFGNSWRSTYEEALTGPDANNNLIYWRGDGSGWTFTYNSVLNSYSLSSPPNERAQLVSNPTGGFTLTLADGTQRIFNSSNLLTSIIDRNNNQTTLTYDSSNRLATVTSPGGSTLTFTYGDTNNPMQATTVQDSVGTVATYTYDSSSRLTLVTYADGSALNFTYDPNSSMILSVTDSQGKLLESHTYDAQDRGLTSSRAYGVNSVSLTY